MKEIIVNIKNIDDLKEKYSNDVSSDLIKYILKESRGEKGKIKIIVKSELELKNVDRLIKDGLLRYLNEASKIDKLYDKKQIIFFIIGLICLFISTLMKFEVLKEIILIAGWVSIWEVVDIALNAENKIRYDKKIIKKLINSNIEFQKIK